jgi:hypothetical protein
MDTNAAWTMRQDENKLRILDEDTPGSTGGVVFLNTQVLTRNPQSGFPGNIPETIYAYLR